MDDAKPCNRCGAVKPLTDFYRDRGLKDGRRNTCIACDKEHDRRPEVMERKRQYHYTEAGRASERKYAESEKGKAARAAYEERPERIVRKKETQNAYGRASYHRHKEAIAEKRKTPEARVRQRLYNRKHYYRNIEATQAYHRTWQQSEKGQKHRAVYWSREDVRARKRAWQRIYEHIRRARKAALPSTLTDTEWLHALDYFGNRCAYCQREAKLVQEHVIPVIRGGAYTADNIVPACKQCNHSKNARPLEKWAAPDAYRRVMDYLASVAK